MKNRDFLEIFEYFALALFIFGVVVTTVLRWDILWAALPLLLFILLNIYNRSRVEHLAQRSLRSVSKLESIEAGIEELKAAVQQLSQDDRPTQLSANVRNIQDQIAAVPDLQRQLEVQGQTVDVVLNQLETLTQQFSQRPEAPQLENLTQTIGEISERIADLQQQFNQLTTNSQWLPASAEPVDQTLLESDSETSTEESSPTGEPTFLKQEPLSDSLDDDAQPSPDSEDVDFTKLFPEGAEPSSQQQQPPLDSAESSSPPSPDSEDVDFTKLFSEESSSAEANLQQPEPAASGEALQPTSAEPDTVGTNSTSLVPPSAEVDPQQLESYLETPENLNPSSLKLDQQLNNTSPKDGQSPESYAQHLAARNAENFLRRYQAGQRDFTRINLTGAKLSNECLEGVDLKYSVLNKVDFRGANLDSAILQAADLIEADLRGANMANADLDGVNLTKADLRTTNLRDAYLRGANLSEADLSGANLANASLRGANLTDAKLFPADMIRADLTGAIMPDGSVHQ